MAILRPKRGEVWWVDFDPIRGSEVAKTRPAVVVSNDLSNQHTQRFQVLPLTTNTTAPYPSECSVTVNDRKSKAMADQIRTVSTGRFGKRISTLSPTDLADVENILRLQLGL